MNHSFTSKIIEEVEHEFNGLGRTIFELSPLLQYINKKTKSANRGSKARSSFANLYALYVLIEDYVNKGYLEKGDYAEYEGADFTPLLRRMRELPFGAKLQNHALNNRANDDFHKYFPEDDRRPITRNVSLRKYWINKALLTVSVGEHKYSLLEAGLQLSTFTLKLSAISFSQFIGLCGCWKQMKKRIMKQQRFIRSRLSPGLQMPSLVGASAGPQSSCFDSNHFTGATRDRIANGVEPWLSQSRRLFCFCMYNLALLNNVL